VLVVRAVARIAARWQNSAGAVEKIVQYLDAGFRSQGRMINELLEPWGRHGDYEAYARDVPSEIDFSRYDVDLQNRRRIDHIGYLKTIVTMTLRNSVMDLSPLTTLPRLRRLTLRELRVRHLSLASGARRVWFDEVDGVRSVVLDRSPEADLPATGARPAGPAPTGPAPGPAGHVRPYAPRHPDHGLPDPAPDDGLRRRR
jgi:hypothetical protein